MVGQTVGTAAWQRLLARMDGANARLSASATPHPRTTARAGASASQLAAAEQRIGRRLPAQYRQLLSIADGWERYYRFSNLLGTDDIGQGSRWSEAMDAVSTAFTASNGAFAAMMGVDDDPSNCLPVTWGDDDWFSSIVLFIDDAKGCRSGEVFSLGDDPPRSPDLYTRLYDELLANIDDVVRVERGPHSTTWDRDVRAEPPSTEEILDKIRSLSRRGGLTSWSRPVRPGATAAELDGLAEALGGGLHPDHRDLLAHCDGLDLVQRAVIGPETRTHLSVLSVDDILKGDRWAHALADEQRLQRAWFDEMTANPSWFGAKPDHDEPSVFEAVAAAHVVPFGVDIGPVGIDPSDGHLRWLRDSATLIPERRQTIREMLLDYCDELHQRLTNG